MAGDAIELVCATGNAGKLREVSAVLGELGLVVRGLGEFPPLPEPAETGKTFADNARLKALGYARSLAGLDQPTPRWVLADDSGLAVDALDGGPGVHSARYAAPDLPDDTPREQIDRANNRKLLDALADVPDPQRTARFVCHLALAEGERILFEAHGTVEGVIARAEAGRGGFGYDPLFYLPAAGCTTAELSPEAKNRISHRGQAVRQLSALMELYLQRS
jgi:XTP/dITP diphosphohydrolase